VITEVKPGWEEDWQRGDWAHDQSAIDWLLSRPEPIQKLLLRFPPSCLVRANRPLKCPLPKTVGIVVSYIDPDEGHTEGMVTVRQHPEGGFRAVCRPEWLEVVGFHRGMDHEWILRVLTRNLGQPKGENE
jgi:hypothetical protein